MEHAGNPRGPIETKKRDRISTEFNLSIYQPPKQAPGLIRFIFIVNHKAKVTEVEQKKKVRSPEQIALCRFCGSSPSRAKSPASCFLFGLTPPLNGGIARFNNIPYSGSFLISCILNHTHF